MSKKFDLLANKFRSTCTKYKLNSIDDNECGNQLKNILTDLNESINNEINTFSGNNYELGYKRIGNKNLFFPDDIKNLKDGKLKNMITILYVFLDKKNNDGRINFILLNHIGKTTLSNQNKISLKHLRGVTQAIAQY